jgi:Xaa-Pro aminopeptidase
MSDLIAEKLRQSVALLNEFDIDCWITFVRETSLNGDPTLPFLVPADLTWQSALIITRTGQKIAIVGKYDTQSIEDLHAYDTVVGYVEGIRAPLHEALAAVGPRSIAVNYSKDSEVCDGITHGMYLTLVELLSAISLQDRIVSAERIISALRQRKSAWEIGAMREAIRHTQEIFELVTPFITPGRTERGIAAFMRDEVARRGLAYAWDQASCPAVFTGPDTAEAHYGPTERRVEPGHVLNMDFGLRVCGYCSDLQRTFYILAPGEQDAPPDVVRGFDTIRRAVEEARAAMRPGVTGMTVDKAAREVITAAGYAEFPHALGHQVGRFAHDGTALLGPAWEKYGRKPFQPLEEGMVFTIEPRLTVPGRGVVTIEEMVVVGRDGAAYLSAPQTSLILRS